MPTYAVTISPSRRCVFAALFSLLILFQGCQSDSKLSVTDEYSLEAPPRLGRPTDLPTPVLPSPVVQQAHDHATNAITKHSSGPGTAVSPTYGPLTAARGEHVHFQHTGSQWQAMLSTSLGRYTQTLPVTAAPGTDIASMLAWLQGKDAWTSRARIHLIPASSSPNGRASVHLGKVGLLGGCRQGIMIQKTWRPE